MPPRLSFLAAGFAAAGPVALRAILAFDRVTLGFSFVLLVMVSKTLGAVALGLEATFVDGIGFSGEAGWAGKDFWVRWRTGEWGRVRELDDFGDKTIDESLGLLIASLAVILLRFLGFGIGST